MSEFSSLQIYTTELTMSQLQKDQELIHSR